VYQQFHGFHYCWYRKHADCIHFKQHYLKINQTKPAILVEIPVNVWMLDFKLSWWAERNILKSFYYCKTDKLHYRTMYKTALSPSLLFQVLSLLRKLLDKYHFSLTATCLFEINLCFSFKLMNFSPVPTNPLSLLPFPICSSQLPSICRHSNLFPH